MDKFENLQITKVIIHEVYKRELTGEIKRPFFNTECCTLGTQEIEFLRQRITGAMSSRSSAIFMEIDNDGENSIFQYIKSYWENSDSNDENFIALSKEITHRLTEAQVSKGIPGGVVVVLEGTVQEINKPFVAIIKAESQNGFTLEKQDERRVLRFLRDLFLTPHQKLQKVGLFINNAVHGRKIMKTDIDAFVFDSNADSANTNKATYFYNNFLGLKYRSDSNVVTNKFFMSTKEFIQQCNEFSSTQKIDKISALISYLKFEVNQFVNANEFADRIFENSPLKRSYLDRLESEGISCERFRKDLSLADMHMKKRQIILDNKIKLFAPTDNFDDMVKITDNEDGTTSFVVQGKIQNER